MNPIHISKSEHKHFHKSNHTLIEASDIINCSVIIVTSKNYPLVHLYRTVFPKIENSIFNPTMEDFTEEIENTFLNSELKINEIGFTIIGQTVSKKRIDYMRESLENIYDLPSDKIDVNIFEYSDIMNPDQTLRTVINNSKVSFQNNLLTIQYHIQYDIYQISGPSHDKKEIHFINKNGLWLENNYFSIQTPQKRCLLSVDLV